MGKIWDERNEWQTMLDVEIAACEANAKLGRIPEEAVKVIKEKANFDVDRIHEIDHEINHDIIAFLTNVGEYVGDEAKYIHMGLTSTDVKDTDSMSRSNRHPRSSLPIWKNLQKF